MLFAAVDTNAVIGKIWRTIESNQDLIAQKTIDYGPKVLTAGVILVIGLFIGRWLGKAVMLHALEFAWSRDCCKVMLVQERLWSLWQACFTIQKTECSALCSLPQKF